MAKNPETIIEKAQYFQNVVMRQAPFYYRFLKTKKSDQGIKVIGLIRERNEALILQDTLDHIAQFVDGVIVYDDASTDNSVEVALRHPIVNEVIVNRKWRQSKRIWEETANRRLLHERGKRYDPEWFFYFDADERFEGDIKNYLTNECPDEIQCIRISLLDAYLTKDDKQPYDGRAPLHNFRKYFGPEQRDILMLWRNVPKAVFQGLDARQPAGFTRKETEVRFYCQHYGKSLSIEHWEQTCDYYASFFPKYAQKWLDRKGKAVHSKSDFGKPLYTWKDAKKHAVDMDKLNASKSK